MENYINHIKHCKAFKNYIPSTSRCKRACAFNDCCLTCKYFPKYCKSQWTGKLICIYNSFLARWFGKIFILNWWKWKELWYPKIKAYLINIIYYLYLTLLLYSNKVKRNYIINNIILISKRVLNSMQSNYIKVRHILRGDKI